MAAFAVLRRIGLALGGRAVKKCEEMFDRMPEEFPLKRMMRSLDEIHEQNTLILHHLEQRDEDR